jgi:hypothetical protein
MDYADDIATSGFVVGIEEHGVLHDLGVDSPLGAASLVSRPVDNPLGTSKKQQPSRKKPA